MRGESIHCPIDEQIIYNQLDNDEDAIWSLLLASGYLKALDVEKKVAGKPRKYEITSNLESGFGRYDVMLEPKDRKKDAFILEFKAFRKNKEKTLEDTLASAKEQIEEKQYGASLTAKGFPKEQIHRYGLAFDGKRVLIG